MADRELQCQECGAIFDVSWVPPGATITKLDCNHNGWKGVGWIVNGSDKTTLVGDGAYDGHEPNAEVTYG